MKRALITGITGQDGSYLAEHLLSKGYKVHGIIRRSSTFNTERIDHLYQDPHEPMTRLFLYFGDLSDSGRLTNYIYNLMPDEIYHLGAQSHVRVSFDMPELTGDVTGLGTVRVLEAIRRSGAKIKFYQASSSEMFGSAAPPQNEKTPLLPRSPYAAAKVYAYHMVRNYREAYGIFACNGILFNHESPRRGETFVTRKITRAIPRIRCGLQRKLYLGNLDAKRDWGYAPEYIEAMWLMVQQDKPDDYVIGTGEAHSVREFVEQAFGYAGIEIEWRGEGTEEKGVVRSLISNFQDPPVSSGPKAPSSTIKVGDILIEIDPRYYRPTEVGYLLADTSKAREKLGWVSRVSFRELIRIMVDYDMELSGLKPLGEGKKILAEKDLNWTKNQLTLQADRMIA